MRERPIRIGAANNLASWGAASSAPTPTNGRLRLLTTGDNSRSPVALDGFKDVAVHYEGEDAQKEDQADLDEAFFHG
jgi:hypothetical protein